MSLTLGRAQGEPGRRRGSPGPARRHLEAFTSANIGSTAGWVSWDAKNLVQGWVSKTYSNYGLGVSGPTRGAPTVVASPAATSCRLRGW